MSGSKIIGFLSVILFISTLIFSCNITGPSNLFSRKSPHDQYAQQLTIAGLNRTTLGLQWLLSGDKGLLNPISISLPYKQTGYFASERIQSEAFLFTAGRGERITVTTNKKSKDNCSIFVDLWKYDKNSHDPAKLVAYADTADTVLNHDVTVASDFIVRLQPELLCSCEYTVIISVGPSLGFPIRSNKKSSIGSYFGDPRDRGARLHEGIDIFAEFRTPVIAVASGIVTAVNENALGGKAVWLKPTGKDYQLYYAHLDTQIVHTGEIVKEGDTLGLVGNTGNARLTGYHLHFGIYAPDGAVDPLPFINPVMNKPTPITSSLSALNDTMRIKSQNTKFYSSPNMKRQVLKTLPVEAVMRIEGATSEWYQVRLPDGTSGFLNSKSVENSRKALRAVTLNSEEPLYDYPDSLAARKILLATGSKLNVVGEFEGYVLVMAENESGWIRKKIISGK